MSAMPSSPRIGTPAVVYICSASRCGSTVFDMFMGSHPEVASLGELNMLGKALRMQRPCSCGELLVDCPAWGPVFAYLAQTRGVSLADDPYALRLWDARARFFVDRQYQNRRYELAFKLKSAWMIARRQLPRPLADALPLPPGFEGALANKMKLYDAVSLQWQRPVVVDSSKNALEAIELVRRWPERVTVVLLTRDGRGVFLSHRNTGMARPDSVRGWRTYYGRSAPMLRRQVPARNLIDLRYEDFATDPEPVGRRLCAALGIAYADAMPELRQPERHMVDGNRTRFAGAKGIRLDERWKDNLDAEEMRYFEEKAGNLNRQLGYQ